MSEAATSKGPQQGSAALEQPSFFGDVPTHSPNAVFELIRKFKEDPNPNKVDLGAGVYRNAAGATKVLDSVKATELLIYEQTKADTLDHSYLPIAGLGSFVRASRVMALGEAAGASTDGRYAGIQCLSGTGALRTAGEFLAANYKGHTVFISNPTWGNHRLIFENAGLKVDTYRYIQGQAFDFAGMKEDLEAMAEGSIVVLHACGHNPTGVDPSATEWLEIAGVCQAGRLFVVFDDAYQGMVTGDLDADAMAMRLFDRRGLSFFICQSFSKNFGLYNERAGCLTIAAKDQHEAKAVLSQMEILVRAIWSNPPNHGARIVSTIFSSDKLFSQWKDDLKAMQARLVAMRQKLHAALVERAGHKDWSHILKHKGMFTFSGLTPEQVRVLREESHVYLLSNGRISIAGINDDNVSYLADAIAAVVSLPSSTTASSESESD